jgi:hypothetical protein
MLKSILPHPVRSDVPAFGSGAVVIEDVDRVRLPVLVARVIKMLKVDTKCEEIAIICVGDVCAPQWLVKELRKFDIAAHSHLERRRGILVTVPSVFRGHERRAVIAVIRGTRANIATFSVAVSTYIAVSRARERLIVLQVVSD